MNSVYFFINMSYFYFLKAFRKDEIIDPLSDPGNADIMSDVDFEELSIRGMQVPNGNIH